MWRNLCEISCGHFPWRLEDENLRKKTSLKFRRVFHQSFEIDRQAENRDRKKHDSQRDDRILHFSPPGNRAIFSTFWGNSLTELHRRPGDSGKIHWRKI